MASRNTIQILSVERLIKGISKQLQIIQIKTVIYDTTIHPQIEYSSSRIRSTELFQISAVWNLIMFA